MYTRNQWKRNTWIFDIILTFTCPSKFCFHRTTVLDIFYQKIILCIDWLSICIVLKYLFKNKLSDSLQCSAWVICIFASCSLSWLRGLHFPNIKMLICSLHIEIFRSLNLKKIWAFLKLVAAVSWKVVICHVYEPLLHFVCTWNW